MTRYSCSKVPSPDRAPGAEPPAGSGRPGGRAPSGTGSGRRSRAGRSRECGTAHRRARWSRPLRSRATGPRGTAAEPARGATGTRRRSPRTFWLAQVPCYRADATGPVEGGQGEADRYDHPVLVAGFGVDSLDLATHQDGADGTRSERRLTSSEQHLRQLACHILFLVAEQPGGAWRPSGQLPARVDPEDGVLRLVCGHPPQLEHRPLVAAQRRNDCRYRLGGGWLEQLLLVGHQCPSG